MKKVSKKEGELKIIDFFNELQNKKPKEIKKIKKLAMNQKISLKKFRKKFCKKCLNPYSEKEKIRVKRMIKNITCAKCGYIAHWKVN